MIDSSEAIIFIAAFAAGDDDDKPVPITHFQLIFRFMFTHWWLRIRISTVAFVHIFQN